MANSFDNMLTASFSYIFLVTKITKTDTIAIIIVSVTVILDTSPNNTSSRSTCGVIRIPIASDKTNNTPMIASTERVVDF